MIHHDQRILIYDVYQKERLVITGDFAACCLNLKKPKFIHCWRMKQMCTVLLGESTTTYFLRLLRKQGLILPPLRLDAHKTILRLNFLYFPAYLRQN